MTDQSPYPPQQPYQPYPQPSAPSAGQSAYAQAPQAGAVQSPYTVGPHAGQPMTAYPAMGYPGMPYPQAMGPQRPSTATAASVLGIVSGGLGIILALIVIVTTSTIDTFAYRTRLEDALATLTAINYVFGFAVLVTAVALLTTGITFLKGKGYGVLLGAAIAQGILTFFNAIVYPLLLPGILGFDSSDLPTSLRFNGGTVFNLLIGLGLAVATIILLLNASARNWRK